MSVNKYMHPRNIYKIPPNFKQLAIDYPEFRQYAKQDIAGKISIDFKDIEALRALTVTLLKKDFGLHLTIPLDRLIPTVPLRLNYVLWLEDLMAIAPKLSLDNSSIKGIDIGTGSSCIYPLLCSKKNGWSMLATETDLNNYKCAQENVMQNKLNNLISVKQVSSQDVILKGVIDESEEYDFCMCNPPFFTSVQDVNPFLKSRTNRRALPRNANSASSKEIVTKGGEVEFISRMINESAELKTKIRIYTTMLGHKSSLPPLKALLRNVDVTSFKQTEFCQGNTTRWGLAWTFCSIDLRRIPQETLVASRKKPKPPLKYLIPPMKTDYTLNSIVEKLQNLLVQLELDVLKLESSQKCAFEITAFKETWKHQRRKKREQMRHHNSSNSNTSASDDSMQNHVITNSPSGITETTNLLSEIEMDEDKHSKRNLDVDNDVEEFCNMKKIKLDPDCSSCSNNKNYIFKCTIAVYTVEDEIFIEMSLIDDLNCNRDFMHQLMQYFKNNLK